MKPPSSAGQSAGKRQDSIALLKLCCARVNGEVPDPFVRLSRRPLIIGNGRTERAASSPTSSSVFALSSEDFALRTPHPASEQRLSVASFPSY